MIVIIKLELRKLTDSKDLTNKLESKLKSKQKQEGKKKTMAINAPH